MANLTLTIDEDVLRRARIRALERGTSVNAVVREFIERYAGGEREREALRAFGELADRAQASSGPGGRSWSRDELYD
jgi:plasmid stability protein